jgi:hypothetical protein
MNIDNDLQKREDKQEQRYKFLCMFQDDIDSDLETIQVAIKSLRNRAKDYYGFDFREELQDMLNDLI